MKLEGNALMGSVEPDVPSTWLLIHSRTCFKAEFVY